jgi:putative Holliday junction resolvase
MKYLGIDFGTKRTGVAVSDEEGRIAFPHSVIHTSKNLVEDVKALATMERAVVFVIGNSLNKEGKENSIMKHVHTLADALRIAGEVFFEDERYSSHHASRGHEENAMHDASTAAIILQSYLDRINRKPVVADPYTLPRE